MLDRNVGTCTIEADMASRSADVQLLNVQFHVPSSNVLQGGRAFRLDYAVGARCANTRARFIGRGRTDRFAPAGMLFLTPPGEVMQLESGIGSQRSVVCHLHVDVVHELLDTCFVWTDRRLQASLDVADLSLRRLLFQLGEEVRNPGMGSAVMIEALLLQIAVKLHRFYSGIEDGHDQGGLAPWRLRMIDDRLRSSEVPPSIAELAALCRISARQLARGFCVSRGISIGRYIGEQRIENAKRRLADGESVKRIAYAVGFSSPSSFCTAFRQSTGFAPGRFRTRFLAN